MQKFIHRDIKKLGSKPNLAKRNSSYDGKTDPMTTKQLSRFCISTHENFIQPLKDGDHNDCSDT